MSSKTVTVSEARRLLPSLLAQVERDGGRVDITRRGKPIASLVRAGARSSTADARADLRIELVVDPDDLPEVIRELRGRVGGARRLRK